MNNAPTHIKGRGLLAMRRLLSSSHLKELRSEDAVPFIMIEPLRFIRPKRALDGSVTFVEGRS